MKEKIKTNFLIMLYLAALYITEFTGVYVTSGSVFIKYPYVFVAITLFYASVLFVIRSQKARYITGTVLLISIGILNLVFIVIYEMTETIFEFQMLYLRNEAMEILEFVPINFTYIAIFGTCAAIFIVFGRRYFRVLPKPGKLKFYPLTATACIAAALAVNILCFELVRPAEAERGDMLYSIKANTYSELGLSGNLLYELAGGIFNKSDYNAYTSDELENFIYDKNAVYYSAFPENVKKQYNVVTILCESLEWFPFIQDINKYPHGYNLDNPDVLKDLFPNLSRFYSESIAMDNFHSREKTDISEDLSMIGSYPKGAFINYSFPLNTVSMSMLNNLKILDNNMAFYYFHDGSRNFYNRYEFMNDLGFENTVFGPDMAQSEGFTDWMKKGERNLDSQMIETCKNEMFPTGERFCTYITSITMHGVYTYRESLEVEGYYDKLASIGETISESGTTDRDTFIYYCAAVMDFDRALGEIYNYLEDSGLLDNTIIALFGDHNAYYQSLSGYVKDTDDTSLYIVPFMIRCPGIEHSVISKFTCTADIMPTICDLLGINLYGNLYYGHSAFAEEESVLYSRAFGVFMTDHILFYTMNRIIWSDEAFTKEYKKSLISRSYDFIDKITACDQIFYSDYFAREEEAETYRKKMLEINGY